ncbi:MATE family efflux transporter [Anaerocolumna sedimenticola]|uniref:Probable multidrug resistance protein NorM n=1 Tax=Anaerocolumna sedimenticola TaxID=2696063 RepID=A0A6P1TJQ7_9FIRM|nr:MATE family efflux transporter [Anaerocolumna sedimenticola]QHQ61334.1 MATE family efflux transporter [Anaerocolumna sedimenticola]
MFTNKQLYKLIIPLIIEQLLAVTVGMVNIIMVARAGEVAVSGVSLVDTLNVLLITIFSSLATGGAVVAAQYIGHKETENACKSAKQLLLISTIIALIIMAFSLLGNYYILRIIYGNIDAAVMDNARIYFYVTSFSFPFLAIYNSCAALFRVMGNSKISMYASLIMNAINIVGSAVLVMGFHMGVMGVAVPALLARISAALIMLFLIRNKKNPIYIDHVMKLGLDIPMIKRILQIGVPNGIENGIFQIGKILVQGLTASFGTVAMSANAVAQTIAGLEIIPGNGIGLAMITVVGQCVGAGDYGQAKKYAIKLLKLTYAIMLVLNIGIILLRNPIVNIFNLSTETNALTLQLIIYHSICCCTIWPIAFALPNAIRAANDVKYTMVISIISMWLWRIGFSYILADFLKLGVLGVWIAMTIDWFFRAICFLIRFINGKWKLHSFIH